MSMLSHHFVTYFTAGIPMPITLTKGLQNAIAKAAHDVSAEKRIPKGSSGAGRWQKDTLAFNRDFQDTLLLRDELEDTRSEGNRYIFGRMKMTATQRRRKLKSGNGVALLNDPGKDGGILTTEKMDEILDEAKAGGYTLPIYIYCNAITAPYAPELYKYQSLHDHEAFPRLNAQLKKAHDVSREARLPKGAKGGGEFTKTGAAVPAAAPPAALVSPHPNARPPKGIHALPLKDIRVDPAKFQFRQDVNPDNGTDDRLAGVEKYDPFLAGIISVWEEPSTGRVYVADGHHRYALAKRLRVREVNVQFIDAPNAKAAMCIAGVKNVAEGHSTPLDAANLLRANGIGEKALRKANVALTGTLASKALALSTLAEPVYQDVLSGRMDEGRGVAIAQAFASHPAQIAVRDMLMRPEYRRKRLSDADIRELSHFVSTAGKQTKTIATLFGDESLVQSLAVEKAQVSAGIKAKLKADKTLFGFVAKQGRAEALKRGNNVIDTAASGTIHDEATRMLEMYDRLAGYAGPVSAALNAGAKQLAAGGEKNAIVNGVYGEVRRILGEEPLGANTAGAGRSGSGSGASDPAGSGLESGAGDDGGLFRGVSGRGSRSAILKSVRPTPHVRHAIASAQKTKHNEGSYYGDWPGRRIMHEYSVHFEDGKYPQSVRGQTREEAIERAHSERHQSEHHSAVVADMSRNPHQYTRQHYVSTFQLNGAGRVVLGETHASRVAEAVSAGKRVPAKVLADYPELASHTAKKSLKLAVLFKSFSQHIGGGKIDGVWGEHNGKNAFIAKNGDIYQRSGGKSTPFTVVHGPSLHSSEPPKKVAPVRSAAKTAATSRATPAQAAKKDVSAEARVPKGSAKGGEFTRAGTKPSSATSVSSNRPPPILRPFEKEHEAAARGIVYHKGELRWADEVKGQPTGFQLAPMRSGSPSPEDETKQDFLKAHNEYTRYHNKLIESAKSAVEASKQRYDQFKEAYESATPGTSSAKTLKKKMEAIGWKENALSAVFGPSAHHGEAKELTDAFAAVAEGRIDDPTFHLLRDEMRRRHALLNTEKPVKKSLKLAVLFTPETLDKCCGKGKDCDGSGSKGKPSNNLSQLVRDAHHANKHVVADACDHENAEKVLIAGEGGKKYPATHCKRCGRIALDDKKHHKLASGKVPMPVLMKAVADGLYKAHDVSREKRDSDGKWTDGVTQIHSSAFREWFGDSKVVTKPTLMSPSKPVVMYHGTKSSDEFDEFSPDHLTGNTGAKTAALGFFFTDDPYVASDFAGDAGHVKPVYISMKNPLEIGYTHDKERKSFAAIDPHTSLQNAITKFSNKPRWDEVTPDDVKACKQAVSQVYDGIILRLTAADASSKFHTVAIAFRPGQIKSAIGNNGDFDILKHDITKAVASNCYKDPKSCDLRWITAHPNGEEPGVPLLVHDNGDEYTVVGGAGGKMNQQVFQKPKGDASGNERKAQMKEKRIAKQKAAREALGADAQDLEDKKKALHEAAKQQASDITQRALSMLGPQFTGDAVKKIEDEARKRAMKEKPNATEGEQKEFADKTVSEAKSEAHEAVKKIVQAALTTSALRALGDDDGTAAEFAVKLSGAHLVKKLTNEQVDELTTMSANLAATRGAAKAIQRALATGDQDAVQGIAADVAPLSAEEVKTHNLDQYLKEDSVNANTALVKGSEAASTITQRRNQANGASDGLNSFVAAQTGSAILRPDLVKTLGVENAARVAAAYLTANGKDAGGTAAGLRDRIGNQSYASAKAALDKVDEMDRLVQNAKEAAAQGDGSVTTAQSSIMAATFASHKQRLLNTARGELRSAAALAHHLEHPSKRSLSLPGGSTAIAAHAMAKGLGMKEGEYAVEKAAHGEGGGYKVTVQADDLHKMATPHKLSQSDRNIQADEIRQEVEANPGQTDLPGFRKDRMLQPHQEVAVKAITEMKHTVLSFGAGSGKTAILMAAGSKLLASGKIDKGLITMPAKPLAQQNDYTDPEDGETKQGEIGKFLDGDAAKNFVVCNGSDQVAKALKRIKGGEKLILMMTPDAMRNNAAALKEAGFGGEKSAFFADEAHRFAVGQTEGTGSGMAKIAGDFAKSEYSSYMSGTLIENNASELWSALDAIHPGQFGGQKAFTEEWQRLSKGQQGLFASEAMRGMRDRLSGSMFSYHSPVKGANGEALTLESNVVTVKSTPAQKAAIAKVNAEYKKRKASDKPELSKGASFWRHAQTKRILTDGAAGEDGAVVNPKMEALHDILKDEKARDPKNRIGVYAFNKSTLKAAGDKLGGQSVKITGDEDEKKTAAAVKKVNDRENGLDAAYLSNAANYGLNLQGLSRIIKMHALDTPSMEDQLDHRHFRTGQTRDVRATTILTDHPAEQLAQFRNKSMKAPEVHLLAALADDTGAAGVLARNMDALKAVAG